jgi:hypothetical protein
MKLIAERLGRNDKLDRLRCIRRDGSETATSMPRQGILPHDLVHYVAESGLGWRHGFLGMIEAGHDIGWTMEQTHGPANASNAANRAVADQAIHAEAVVESLQAQLWSGAFDEALFLDGVRSACEARGRGVPALAAGIGGMLFEQALALQARWQQVPFHGQLELEMPAL